jgi:hypothetical protein
VANDHGPPWEKDKSGAPNEETIRPFELFLHSEPETSDDAGARIHHYKQPE